MVVFVLLYDERVAKAREELGQLAVRDFIRVEEEGGHRGRGLGNLVAHQLRIALFTQCLALQVDGLRGLSDGDRPLVDEDHARWRTRRGWMSARVRAHG